MALRDLTVQNAYDEEANGSSQALALRTVGDPDVAPSLLVRDSWLDAHVGTPAWSNMSGWPWQGDDLAEHGNTGPGAAPAGQVIDGRPQLTGDEAATRAREAPTTLLTWRSCGPRAQGREAQ